jgi:hypothetical protein
MKVREVIRGSRLEFHFEGLRLEGVAIPPPSVQTAVVEVA